MVFTSSIYLSDTYILLPFAVLEELARVLLEVNGYEDTDMKS